VHRKSLHLQDAEQKHKNRSFIQKIQPHQERRYAATNNKLVAARCGCTNIDRHAPGHELP
jgi:hypothetical protein